MSSLYGSKRRGVENSVVTALTYTRVSSEDQRDGVSLDSQLAMCREYIARQGWVLGDEYQDVLSGKRDDRPSYQALLEDVRILRGHGRQVAVVVARLDRFGRRLLERVRAREELKSLGVPTHSVREGGEVSDLVANILASVAEEESRRLGERVSDARRHITDQGWFYPARYPWGYLLRDATEEERKAGSPKRVMDENPETAPYVREAFRQVINGATMRHVARWIARLSPEARGGRVFRYPNVWEMFHSPAYVARPEYGADDVLARPVGRWPALVSDEGWRQLGDELSRHAMQPRQASGMHLLTGIIRCPNCGSRMYGKSASGGKTASYRCWSHTILGAESLNLDCQLAVLQPPLNSSVLDQVISVVERFAGADAELRASIRRRWQALQAPALSAPGAQQVKGLERRAAQARDRLACAARLLVDGALDRAGYEALRAAEVTAMEAAELELARLRSIVPAAVLPDLGLILSRAGGWEKILRASDIPTQREVLATLVDHAIPVRVKRAQHRAEIVWTPIGAALQEALRLAATESAA